MDQSKVFKKKKSDPRDESRKKCREKHTVSVVGGEVQGHDCQDDLTALLVGGPLTLTKGISPLEEAVSC